MDGWIKLHRKFIEWEWFCVDEMVKLFIYLLLSANYEDKSWRGIEVKRGQLITGIISLSEQTKISQQTLRTCLSRLEKTGEINRQSTNKYTIITICNYDSYQNNEETTNIQTNKPLTNDQQTTNKQLTTTKEVKNIKKEYIQFYFSEIETNEKGKLINEYKQFYEYISGKNEIKAPFQNWLQLEHQLTYEQFEKIVKKSKEKNKKIAEMLMSGFNNPAYLKGRKVFYSILNTWLNR